MIVNRNVNEHIRDACLVVMVDGELDCEFDWKWTRDVGVYELLVYGWVV